MTGLSGRQVTQGLHLALGTPTGWGQTVAWDPQGPLRPPTCPVERRASQHPPDRPHAPPVDVWACRTQVQPCSVRHPGSRHLRTPVLGLWGSEDNQAGPSQRARDELGTYTRNIISLKTGRNLDSKSVPNRGGTKAAVVSSPCSRQVRTT